MKGTWTVAVVYESAETRETGVAFCDCLVQKFWSQFGFDVSWWSFSSLADPGAATEALKTAVTANFIVFASSGQNELPEHVQNWVEECVRLRAEREGTLVALPPSADPQPPRSLQIHFYLRDVAHRAGMDYLTGVPQTIGEAIPDSLEFFSERAEAVTSVLDEILHQPPPPPRCP